MVVKRHEEEKRRQHSMPHCPQPERAGEWCNILIFRKAFYGVTRFEDSSQGEISELTLDRARASFSAAQIVERVPPDQSLGDTRVAIARKWMIAAISVAISDAVSLEGQG